MLGKDEPLTRRREAGRKPASQSYQPLQPCKAGADAGKKEGKRERMGTDGKLYNKLDR
jgi:hypothetical protein